MRKLGSTPTQNWERLESPVRVSSLTWTTPADDWIAAYGEQGGFGFSAEITNIGGEFKIRISEDGTEVYTESIMCTLEEAKAKAEQLVDGMDHTASKTKTAGVTWGADGDWTSRGNGEHTGTGLSVYVAEPHPGQFEIVISDDENTVHSEGFSGDLNGAKAHADVLLSEYEQYGDWG